MSITGKVIVVGQSYTGTNKLGNAWRKQEYVIETDGQYPRKVAFYVMNDKIDQAAIQLGHVVEIEFDPESREYNGRWYTNLTAWKVVNRGVVNTPAAAPVQAVPVYQQSAPQGYAAPQYQQMPPAPAQTQAMPNTSNDLPF